MVLSDIQCLTPKKKCLWLNTSDGLAQLAWWRQAGLPLKKIARLLNISVDTLRQWRDRYPAIQQIVQTYASATSKPEQSVLITVTPREVISAVVTPTQAVPKKVTPKDAELAQTLKIDHTRPAAYRIIIGHNEYRYRQGTVIAEYDTAEALWDSDFIHKYFASFGLSERDYYDRYIQSLIDKGMYRLSNAYCVAYCQIDKKGFIRTIKSTL